MPQVWSVSEPLDYAQALAFQRQWVTWRHQERVPDTLLFLEHLPVITRGRGLQWTGQARSRHQDLPPELLLDFPCYDVERGGDLTYHGPGQWVVYPLFSLNSARWTPAQDILAWLRFLEATLVRVLQGVYQLTTHTRSQATGLWLGDQKVASLGLAFRHWVSFHGIALNVVNDLSPFRRFSPCGFDPQTMTRVVDHLSPLHPSLQSMQTYRLPLETAWCEAWQLPPAKILSAQGLFSLLSKEPASLKDSTLPS